MGEHVTDRNGLIEAMAIAACRAAAARHIPAQFASAGATDAWVGQHWRDFLPDVCAALSAIEAAGFVVVPREALPRVRQWFEEVQDVNPACLERADYVLAADIYGRLGRRVPGSIRAVLDATPAPTVTRDGPVTAIHDPTLPVDPAGILAVLRSWGAQPPARNPAAPKVPNAPK